ncbi:MAG TPA: UxaA family hydrolase, partial [Cellvibrionaceae bacterium]
MKTLTGYLREDGRKGIRNVVVVAYLVECAHHVSRKIVQHFDHLDIHLIGFPGCYPNTYASDMMRALTRHPNVGGVLLVSLGCESMDRDGLQADILASGRPAELLVIQETGGTASTIAAGIEKVAAIKQQLDPQTPVPMALDELVVGTICGGSDGTSGITANPAVGRCFDKLVAENVACMFEETGELI